jgi:cyclophilin family peptidyl-prolyl cis-trans isomerase
MATKKKNSNYQTEKSAQKQAAKEAKIKAKATKRTVLACVFTVLFISAVILSGFLLGLFEYVPKATSHVSISLSDGTNLHVELYGDAAPKTVANFEKLCGASYLKDRSILSYENGAIYFGDDDKANSSQGVTGEFKENGIKNKVPFTRGTIVMERGEDFNSGYGQFFILTEDKPELEGKYAAFGCVTDGLDKLIETLEGGGVYYENGTYGKIVAGAPTIKSTSAHASH